MTCPVVIADDQPVVVAGVETILKKHRYTVVARVHDTDTLLQVMEDVDCEVLVTDLCLPDGRQADGVALIRRIRIIRPDVGIVVMTHLANVATLRLLLDLGVAALFDKRANLRDMPSAVHSASLGRTFLSPAIRRAFLAADRANACRNNSLSPREVAVLRAYSQGLSLADIGARMLRSIKTISRQKRSAMTKLGLQNDAQLYQYLANMRAGLIDGFTEFDDEEDAIDPEAGLPETDEHEGMLAAALAAPPAAGVTAAAAKTTSAPADRESTGALAGSA
jgi:two-component system, NarL family, captular synthesis response regulator RcsB